MAEERPETTEDVVLVHGMTEDRKGLAVIRKQGDVVSAGCVRPLEEGKSVQGDVVRLKPRAEAPLLCDVEVEHAHSSPAEKSGGPAQVATTGYREGWESIWGQADGEDHGPN